MRIASLIFLLTLTLFCRSLMAQETDGITVEDKSELDPGENIDEVIKKNFFLHAEVSKTECFVGEPVMAVFKAYSRLDANSQVLKRPSLGGFSVIEMVDSYSNQPDIERFNGENYYVHLIRKVQLFPLQAGSFVIEPAEVESVIHLRKSNSRIKSLRHLRDFFRRRQPDPSLERQMVFKTAPLNVSVSALPEKDQPADYAGAVGDFLIQLQMPDTTIEAREPTTVKLIISGTGNFPLVTEPEVQWPPSAEVSRPSVTEQVNKYAYPLSGLKSYQFTIEHRDTGTFTIPSVQFSYFDPESKTYKIAKSNEVKYTVANSISGQEDKNAELVFKTPSNSSLHYYYFGAVAVIIISLIIYFILRPPKKSE